MAGVVRPLLIVVLIVVLLVAALWLLQRKLIYLPDASRPPPAADMVPGARDVVLDTEDGLRLGAWLVPPLASAGAVSRPDRRMAVLAAPGNGGNRVGRVGFARALAAEGFTVLLLEYRGYGGNPGSPTEAGLAADVRAARAFLAREGWTSDRILYYGESLGCGVVADLAANDPPAGLILRSPFVDLAAVGQRTYPFLPVRLLLWDRFPVADMVARVPVPTLVIYGDADTVIPPEQSQEVARRAAGPTQVVAIAGADHNDAVLFEGDQLVAAIVSFATSSQ
jgi:uncharacterized protein